MNRRGSGLLAPWELYRKVALGASFIGLVFLTVLLTFPIGFAVVFMMVAAAMIWKPIGLIANPRLGTYMPGTYPFAVARFFTAYNIRKKEALSPVVALGAGPPLADPDHNLEAGFFPPTRISSYWALLGAILLAGLDWPLQFVRFPFWHGVSLPWYASYVLSVIGWLFLIQSIMHIRRLQADGTGVIGVEPAPAALLSKVHKDTNHLHVLLKSLSVGGVLAGVVAVLWIAFKLPTLPSLILIAFMLVLGFLITESRLLTKHYRSKWENRKAQRDSWNGIMSFMRDDNPVLISEMQLPTFEEWQESADPDSDEPYAPKVNVATFMFPPSSIFKSYVGSEEQINGQLGATHSAIAPIGEVDPDSGQEIPGSIGTQGMRIWWIQEIITIKDILDPDLDEWLREFGVRAIILPIVSNSRGIGYCSLVSCNIMTRTTSSAHIIEVKIMPPSNTSLSDFLSQLTNIQTTLGVPWVRAVKDSTEGGSHTITLMIGADPLADGIKFTNPASIVRYTIDAANWSYYFHVNGISGDSGTPSMIKRRSTTPIVEEIVFSLPPGLSYKSIDAAVPSLKTTSGNAFIESTLGSPSESNSKKILRKRGGTDINLLVNSTKFTMISSREDPLNRLFRFSDYKKDLILGRVRGQEKITWSPGVLANDELAIDSFDSNEPHLLLAGSSGSGKHLDVSTEMLTSDGWKKMGDLEVGDTLYDMDGNPTKVVHAYDNVVPETAYDVVLNDGTSVRASGTHLWTVVDKHERYRSSTLRARRDEVMDRIASIKMTSSDIRDMASDFRDRALDRDLMTGVGDAWLQDDKGRVIEATSWIEAGANDDDGIHSQSRLGVSAVRGVSPQMWGAYLASALKYRPDSTKFGALDFDAMQSVAAQDGYWVSDNGTPGRITYGAVDGFAPILRVAMEPCDNMIALAADIMNIHDMSTDILSGLRVVMDSGRMSVGKNNIETVRFILDSFKVEYRQSERGGRWALEIAEGVIPEIAAGDPRLQVPMYYRGLWASSRSMGLDRKDVVTISDPSVRHSLLERGLAPSIYRDNVASERILVRKIDRFIDVDDMTASPTGLSQADADEFIAGFMSGKPTIDGERVVVDLDEEFVSFIDLELIASISTADINIERAYGRVTISAKASDLGVTASDAITMVHTVRKFAKYDRDGNMVMSYPELGELIDRSRAVVDPVLHSMEPTASWRAPIIQRYRTGTVAKVSAEIVLYRVDQFLDALAEVVEGRIPSTDWEPSTITLTTEELIDGQSQFGDEARYALLQSPINYESLVSPLPVDPYVLGAFLGDGISRTGAICGQDDGIFEEIEGAGYEPIYTVWREAHDGDRFRTVSYRHIGSGEKLRSQLHSMSLIGSGMKHIPTQYKTASFDDRVSLLQGLMDTDGSYNTIIALSNKQLADDTEETLRSLGIKVGRSIRIFDPETSGFKNAKPSHRLTFVPSVNLHRLARKYDHGWLSDQDRVAKYRYIKDIRPVDQGEIPEMRCITVDSPTKTYRAGRGLIPTHNSVFAQNFIIQMAANNHPDDVQMWMVEPKIGLQRFQHLDLVTRFVDSWTPNERFYESVAQMSEDLVTEMKRRNRILRTPGPRKMIPEKLAEGRSIALAEGPDPVTGAPHPMMMPYLFVIVEECGTIFADSSSKEEREQQAVCLSNFARVAREGRSAGIHLIFMTQYPTNASIPSVIKKQCRRIGLACQDALASRVVIDRNGLEELHLKGTGMVLQGTRDYRQMRGFFLEGGNPDRGEANDVVESVESLPTNGNENNIVVSRNFGESNKMVIPNPDGSVFRTWSKHTGAKLDEAILLGKPTRDIEDA